jgi:hypothetical protein
MVSANGTIVNMEVYERCKNIIMITPVPQSNYIVLSNTEYVLTSFHFE